MIFKQIDEIVSGKKTQTRRVVKGRETLRYWGTAVFTPRGYVKWQQNASYAVQPGRGKPGLWINRLTGQVSYANPEKELPDWMNYRKEDWRPLRIVITGIHQECLQDITEDGAKAEGVASVAEYRKLWERINGKGSWAKNPHVWVIEFEVER